MLGCPNCLGIVVVLIKERYFRILQGEFEECLCTIPQSKFNLALGCVTCRISNQNLYYLLCQCVISSSFPIYILKQYSNIVSKIEETINRLGSTISDAVK